MSFPAWQGCYECGRCANKTTLKGVNYANIRVVAMCVDCMPKYHATYPSALLLVLLENLGLENQVDYEIIEMCHAFAPNLELKMNKNP